AAVGWANSIADGLRVVQRTIPGVVDLIKTGQFNTEAWADTDIGSGSRLVSGLLIARGVFMSIVDTVTEVVGAIRDRFAELSSGSEGDGFTRLGDAALRFGSLLRDDVIPLLGTLATTLGTAFVDVSSVIGISTWELFLTTLELALGVLESLAPALQVVADWLKEHNGLVTTAVALYVGYNAAVKAISFAQLIISYITMNNLRKLPIFYIYGEIAAWVALRLEV